MGGLLLLSQKMASLDPEIKRLPRTEMDEQQLDKWSSNLSFAVISNECCLFWIRKLREYRSSRFQLVFCILDFIALLIITTILFAYINMAISKYNTISFAISGEKGFFDFFYYSFNKLFLQTIPDINPISIPAKALSMIQMFFSFSLTALFLSFFLTTKKDADESGLEAAVEELNRKSQTVQEFVLKEFSVTIDQAINELEGLKKGVAAAINNLRGGVIVNAENQLNLNQPTPQQVIATKAP